jgi:hypothetical protein
MGTSLDVGMTADPVDHPDYYLVLTGPGGSGSSSKGRLLAISISAVYLFDAHELVAEQIRRNVKLGIASSVPYRLWTAAMIYPDQVNLTLQLTED